MRLEAASSVSAVTFRLSFRRCACMKTRLYCLLCGQAFEVESQNIRECRVSCPTCGHSFFVDADFLEVESDAASSGTDAGSTPPGAAPSESPAVVEFRHNGYPQNPADSKPAPVPVDTTKPVENPPK